MTNRGWYGARTHRYLLGKKKKGKCGRKAESERGRKEGRQEGRDRWRLGFRGCREAAEAPVYSPLCHGNRT